jgi:hypothetical protein
VTVETNSNRTERVDRYDKHVIVLFARLCMYITSVMSSTSLVCQRKSKDTLLSAVHTVSSVRELFRVESEVRLCLLVCLVDSFENKETPTRPQWAIDIKH